TPTPAVDGAAAPVPVPLPGAGTAAAATVGDCNGDGVVNINELILGVNIALARRPLADCRAFDVNGDGAVAITELIQAVNAALHGPPTPTATPSGQLTRLVDASPANGEGDVAVTRETILRFSAPLDAASVSAAAVHADFGGARLNALLHTAP